MKAFVVFEDGTVDSIAVLNDDDPRIEQLKTHSEIAGYQFQVVQISTPDALFEFFDVSALLTAHEND